MIIYNKSLSKIIDHSQLFNSIVKYKVAPGGILPLTPLSPYPKAGGIITSAFYPLFI